MREDWIEITLEDAKQDSLIGLVRSSGNQNNTSIGTPYLKMNNIDLIGNVQLSNLVFVDVSDVEIEKYSLEFGDILINTRNSYELVGKTGIVRNISEKVVFNNNIMRLRLKQGFDNFFIGYQLISPFIRKQMEKHKKATTSVCALYQRNLFPLKLKIAPLTEQRAIVAKIEELFSDLDKGIADLKKAQEQLKVYRQAVLKKAFEGELTKEWREKQTNLPSADELLLEIKEERQKHFEQQVKEWKRAVKKWETNGKEGKKPVKPKAIQTLPPLTDYEIENLPPVNENWKWAKIDHIAGHNRNSLKAGPFGSSLKKSFYTEKGYKVYGQEQVISGDPFFGDYYVNEEKFLSLINCEVAPFDILISLVGTVGKVLVLPDNCEKGIINPRLVKITLNSFYEPIFFKYFFESSFLKSLYKLKNHGTTMDVLNLGSIKELPFPICSKKEQHQIVQEIESRLSVCDKVEQNITESLEKAQALRQSILKKAFEGTLLSEEEIAKCKSAKDYEPASVLLEKIKAEKKK